ncbi:hypothetical protein [Microbacterium sp. bgisy203]|uniref:hypothetical protein n=1 Tax=Microbacterium sp. bgisy203 TaxID=3413799 RepID=UPI003D707DB2
MRRAPSPETLDTRALTEPLDRYDVRGFTDRLAAARELPARWFSPWQVALMIATAVGSGVFAGALVWFSYLSPAAPPPQLGPAVFALFSAGMCVGASFVAARLLRAARPGSAARRLRLSRFAQANGLNYTALRRFPRYPGMLFQITAESECLDVVSYDRPRHVEVGSLRYRIESGRVDVVARWGYAAFRVRNELPHIVLDARKNGSLARASTPIAFAGAQTLSLEGDFDRHFSLSCPVGYERDALYLFTPDIMARVIDNAASLDIELVDDWVFLYSTSDLSTTDPERWRWILSVIEALTEKIDQWERWRDERLEDSADRRSPLEPLPIGVAPPGRRLRRTLPWPTVVVLISLGIAAVLGLRAMFFPS